MQDRHFDAELITGDDGSTELRVFDRSEQHDLVLAVWDLAQDEDTGGLRHALDNEDAGHDGETGEVALEVWFGGGNVLDADDAHLFQFKDAVHKE